MKGNESDLEVLVTYNFGDSQTQNTVHVRIRQSLF